MNARISNMINAREGLGVTASIEPPSKILIFRPFAVYLLWADGDRKLVCLCPDEDMPDLVAEGLSTYYSDHSQETGKTFLPIEEKNNH